MKKVFSIVLAVMLTALLAVNAFAASDITADEQKIMDAIEQVRTIAGKEASLPAGSINDVKTYLMRDDVTLDAATAEAIVAKVNECFDIVEEAGITDVKELKAALPTEKKEQLLQLITEAGEVADVVVSYDAAEDKLSFALEDATPIASWETTIKFTGADTTTIVVLSACVLMAIVGGVVAAKKAGLFA